MVDFDEVYRAAWLLDFAEEEVFELGHLYIADIFKYFLPKN